MLNIAAKPKRQIATRWIYNDGGRAAAGFNGTTGDCACRTIAIATGEPYRKVHDGLNALCALFSDDANNDLRALHGLRRWRAQRASADTGIPSGVTRVYLQLLGWRWTSTDKARLHRCDLPPGRIIVSVNRHLVALINNVVHDHGDYWRGHRVVYGYFTQNRKEEVV
jgi:hypothetical protein